MKTTIFPYSLVRYASLDHKQLGSWTPSHLPGEIRAMQEEQQLLAQLKDLVCTELFEKISLVTDDKERQKLITCKRQIFNDKPLSPALVEQIQSITPLVNLLPYLNKVVELTHRQQYNQQQFDAFMISCREELQTIAVNEHLLNGLILSSPLLFEQLPAYIRKHPAQHKHKESKIEFSLLRYITRMCYKTSPFSTFTYTGTMLLNDVPAAPDTPKQIKSNLKLNNHLFSYLINMLKWHPVLNEYLLVTINTTAVEQEGKIKFLINFNNIESFQQINASAVIQFITTLLKNNKGNTHLADLIQSISNLMSHTDPADIKNFLLQLCKAGFLELSTGISGIEENWSEALITYFHPFKSHSKETATIVMMLETLNACRVQYPGLPPDERFNALKQAEALVNTTLLKIEQQTLFPLPSQDQDTFQTVWFRHHDFSAREIFYEDAYTPYQETRSTDPVVNIVEKTELLLELLTPADPKRAEREKMSNFFHIKYGEQARIPLTTFYHDYYLQVKKPEKQTPPATPDEDPWTRQLRANLQQLISKGEHTIRLSAADFPPAKKDNTQQSRGMFVQFFHHPDTDKTAGVINALLPGMGKVNGRFLSLFDPVQQDVFKQYNDHLYPGHLKAEISDGSIFNANIHPPLLPFQIALPGGSSAFNEENRIHVKDITVGLDDTQNELTLFIKEHSLYAFDLCLERISNRSNLYQLLSHFNPDNKPSLQFICKIIDDLIGSSGNITLYPRITFEDDLVLRRKTWEIKTTFIPVPMQGETDYDYYCRFHNWRQEQQLPDYAFLFLRKRNRKGKAGLNDDYKPQLIHFQQPLLIELWKKLLQRAGEYLYLEEVLPDPFTSTEAVKEYLLQWYKY